MFKDRLRELRGQAGFSMDDLADMYNTRYEGRLNKSTLSRYENGLQEPMFGVVKNLADLFGVSTDYFTQDDGGELSADDSLPSGSIRIKRSGRRVKIPLLGRVPAGTPIEAVEDVQGFEEISAETASSGLHFALRIVGRSMEPRLLDGDIVIVRQQDDVDSGDVAIVLVDGQDATVKRLLKHQSGITLQPFNADYEAVSYSLEDIEQLPVRVIGKVVESRRKW